MTKDPLYWVHVYFDWRGNLLLFSPIMLVIHVHLHVVCGVLKVQFSTLPHSHISTFTVNSQGFHCPNSFCRNVVLFRL